MTRSAAMVLLLLCASANANIYRCDRDGKLQFSDRACVANQIPVEILAPNVMETSASERLLAQAFDAQTTSLRARRAVEKTRSLDPKPAKIVKSRPAKEPKRRATKQSKPVKKPIVQHKSEDQPKLLKPRR